MSVEQLAYHYTFNYPVTEIVKVVDGDTVRVMLDRGFRDYKKIDVRIANVDTPEVRTRRLLEKEAGKCVTEVVVRWLEAIERDREAELHCVSLAVGKYAGRMIGDLYTTVIGGVSVQKWLSGYLRDTKLALPYDGGTKDVWTDSQLNAVIRKHAEVMDAGLPQAEA